MRKRRQVVIGAAGGVDERMLASHGRIDRVGTAGAKRGADRCIPEDGAVAIRLVAADRLRHDGRIRRDMVGAVRVQTGGHLHVFHLAATRDKLVSLGGDVLADLEAGFRDGDFGHVFGVDGRGAADPECGGQQTGDEDGTVDFIFHSC